MNKDHSRLEMDLAFGSAKPYGSSRSIVRRIAANLPIQPCPRVHFQLFPYNEDTGVLIGTRKQTGLVASLADIAWIDRDDEDSDEDDDCLVRSRFGIPPGLMFRTQRPHPRRKSLNRQRSLPNMLEGASDPQGVSATNDEAIQKISFLETELAKLRAQIAQIVLAQEKTAQSAAATGGPPPPPPFGTLPPPPPPPPPPPLQPPGIQRSFSALVLIKERRGRKANCPTAPESRTAEIPNMLDILKDIDKVKLRSVKSRPGEDQAKLKPREPADAAGLIAEALKRKFAHRYGNGQEDKEDFRLPLPEVKPQTEAPLFGQHMLKQTGKRKFL